jgi:hypothetical protein
MGRNQETKKPSEKDTNWWSCAAFSVGSAGVGVGVGEIR